MKVLVPLRTGTGQNDREHHLARARRVKAERHAVAWLLALHKPPAGPVIVTMCRISPGPGLDAHDNLRASLKAPVDQVAAWLGRDDRDPTITWAYEQRRSQPGEWMVAIEVSAALPEHPGEAGGIALGVSEGGDAVGSRLKAEPRNGGPLAANDVDRANPLPIERPGVREERDAADVNGSVHPSILTISMALGKAVNS